ncbi:MAG: hypothetical protein K0S47_957 [Herbinix sp.]|jgi:hypothetical protein|nr:hypothetical protein [Herbinix sp.]
MSNKSNLMKQELRKIANYIAVIQTGRFETISLGLSIIYVLTMKFAFAPIYILLTLHVLPLILSFWVKDYAKKYQYVYLERIVTEDKFLLNQLKEKYHYNKLNYLSRSITLGFTVFLLFLWQYRFHNLEHPNHYFENLPSGIIIGVVLIRIVAPFINYIRLHKALSMNKV